MFRSIVVLCIALTGCAEFVLNVPASAPEGMHVTWVRVTADEVAAYCSGATQRLRALGGQEARACTDANPASGRCTIYSTTEVTLATIGDEAAHCFLGAWHH